MTTRVLLLTIMMLACLVFVQARPEPVVDPNIIFTGNLDLHAPALNFKFFI